MIFPVILPSNIHFIPNFDMYWKLIELLFIRCTPIENEKKTIILPKNLTILQGNFMLNAKGLHFHFKKKTPRKVKRDQFEHLIVVRI